MREWFLELRYLNPFSISNKFGIIWRLYVYFSDLLILFNTFTRSRTYCLIELKFRAYYSSREFEIVPEFAHGALFVCDSSRTSQRKVKLENAILDPGSRWVGSLSLRASSRVRTKFIEMFNKRSPVQDFVPTYNTRISLLVLIIY